MFETCPIYVKGHIMKVNYIIICDLFFLEVKRYEFHANSWNFANYATINSCLKDYNGYRIFNNFC